MEKQKEISSGKIKEFHFKFSLVLKALLGITDFLSVAACFWILFWLLYFTVLRDIFDIILYATQKCTKRLKWFCRIAGMSNLFSDITNDFEEKTTVPKFTLDEVDCEEAEEVFEDSPAVISITRNDNDSFQQLEIPSQVTPHNPATKLVSPRRISLSSDGSCKKDVAYVSPLQQSYFRQKIFSWGFRASDSFQTENQPALSSSNLDKIMKIGEKVNDILPVPSEDKEKLIKSDGSPEYIGCCGNLFTFMKNKFLMNKNAECSMHYKRF